MSEGRARHTDADPFVRLAGVDKSYGTGPSRVRALRGVELELYAGELVVVLGPSGSGKTTLLNVIGGIETPTSGSVVVNGSNLAELDEAARTEYRRRLVGFVFQFFNLIPTLTALENVELIAELLGVGGGERSREALVAVGLADRIDHYPGTLSGGEQQRVAIARALVKEPGLLLCDEPTGSLDLDHGRQILSLLRRLPAERGGTVVLVTHNSAIAAVADRIVAMGSGEITEVRHVTTPLAPQRVQW